ncbi:ATP-dependent RecD-like DNA helicase [Eubacteriales bacterium OttesenSCG-928-G02]|nr:ATP-dependent RecD-like DNA helicase [Eubacteriales bacterium OttesenSCG-928-G02]
MNTDNIKTVEGTVEEIIFTNEENGYTVCDVDVGDDLVTLVGTMPFLMPGEHIKAQGEWQTHPSYGRQLRVTVFEKALPEDEEAMFKYLSSGSVKGIGPVTAQRIIDKFGVETFNIIENQPSWLNEIKGITKRRAEEISQSFKAQFGVRSTMMFLNRFFGGATSVKIYRRYQAGTVELIKSNPYKLCTDINGIGFIKADRVAKELGFTNNNEDRIEAGIKYSLMNSAYQGGHCHLPYNLLMQECEKTLGIPLNEIDSVLEQCVIKGDVVKSEYDSYDGYSLSSLYFAEKYIAEKLLILNGNELPFRLEGVDEHIEELEQSLNIEYDTVQKNAIKSALNFGFSIVTGGPGTGKTTVIKAILDIFDALKISYQLAAPTGRAAKRMSEASGKPAKTIHRMLEMVYSADGVPKFMKNEDDVLQSKAIIIDEVSMVDVFLMEALLRAVKNDSVLILIGDVDQLPPVGPGNVLKDIINSERFCVTRLEHIFRQASESLIIVNAHKINNGETPDLTIKNNDFFFIKSNSPNNLSALISSLCRDRLPKTYKVDPFDDIQVITPTKKGEMGTRELNKSLQECLNPKDKNSKEKRVNNVFFRINDKVMQVKNNYELEWRRDGEEGTGIFNGDIGRITDISFKDEQFTINFDGRICKYDFSLTDELEHAYAITVHKSQGSEYPIVIIPAYRCPVPLMTRNLLYTAVTRAKNMLIIVGNEAVITQMAKNDKIDVRFTSLLYFLD